MIYLIALLLSAIVGCFLHPYLVRLALKRNIVDIPNTRKLNRNPVPVLGGVGVFVGFAVSLYAILTIMPIKFPHCYMVPLLLMLGMGLLDDLRDLRPRTKFAVQILAVLYLYFFCGLRIDSFHGVFGIYDIPMVASLPLTLVACVGLINAINLIDGIDGLSSGYGIAASMLFSAWACMHGNDVSLLVACALIGALIPFFIYNVFGKQNKMFMGDAGSHLLGIVFCILALNVIDAEPCDERMEMALIPFICAVLSHPILDTLRVMTMRICSGYSPFKADKTHLHHALIGRGLSHLATTLTIIALDLLVVCAWFVCYYCGMSATGQLLVVIGVAVLCIVLPYPILTKDKRIS